LGRYLLRDSWEIILNRKFFIIGFVLGIASFVGANMYSYHVAEPPCCDFSASFGFPFTLGRTGGFAGGTGLILVGVFADVVVGLVVSVVFGWLFAKSLPPIVNLFRQAGQWHTGTRSQ
jgi:hypothetical protein